MARVDERKTVNDENVEAVTEEPRKGDVLGLGSGFWRRQRHQIRQGNTTRNQVRSALKARVSVTRSDSRRRAKNEPEGPTAEVTTDL